MLRFLLVILSPCLAWASPIVQAPIGDRGTLGLRVDNQSVTAVDVRIGVDEALSLSAQVERFETYDAWVQCIPTSDGQTVSLYAEVGGRRSAIDAHPLAFEDMPPALWMSNRRKGRAHLSSLVQDAYPGLSLRHVRLGDVPNHFGALRFSRLIIISGEDFASLEARQQSAIHNAEAAGVTVVLTAPFGTVSETAFWMEGFSVGDQRPPETYPGTLGEGHVGWNYIDEFPKGEVFITGPDGALAIEVRNGLGRRRLVGVDVAKLPAGEVTRRILSPTMDSVAPVLRWLSGHQPLGPADPPGG